MATRHSSSPSQTGVLYLNFHVPFGKPGTGLRGHRGEGTGGPPCEMHAGVLHAVQPRA